MLSWNNPLAQIPEHIYSNQAKFIVRMETIVKMNINSALVWFVLI